MSIGPKILVSSVFVLLGMSQLVVAQGEATVISDRRGRVDETKGVRITQDSYERVEGKLGGAGRTWKPHEVIEIRWTRAPSDYKKGMNLYRDGEFRQAAQMIKAAIESKGRYPWLPVYGNFYLGRSAARAGFASEAIAAFENVIKADPKHRFVPDAYVELARLHSRPGAGANGAKAAKAALEKVASMAGKLDQSYRTKVDLGLARLEVNGGDAAKGLKALEGLERKTRDEALLNLIAMEKGQALVRMKQYDKAERAFDRILKSKKIQDPEVIAGAANGLGDCQFEQKKFDQAMWSYSRTYALFMDRDTLARQVGWALYRGGEAFMMQAGKASGDERKKLQRYGKRVLNRAAREFRNTRGGKMARQKLGLSK